MQDAVKNNRIGRRQFLQTAVIGAASLILGRKAIALGRPISQTAAKKPNLVYIFADQWRAEAAGYAGNTDVITPNLDKLASKSVNFTCAVSGCPVCSPYRASLMTGQYPLTTGVFLNDVDFKTNAVTLAQAYKDVGYQTAYIGKWHLGGSDRSAFTPREKRLGFEFWKAAECVHDYNNSSYYGDEPIKQFWDGYDAIAQSAEACKYIREHTGDKPFILFLSWGPPHEPYNTAPEKYKNLFKDKDLKVRPNVPEQFAAKAKEDLAGYYAHITALDDCIGNIVETIKDTGIENDTILVFTSDHGDMLYSQGWEKKQRPWDESILVPFLLRYPAVLGTKGRTIDMPINAPDIMPTLLGLSGIEIPKTVEGADFSAVIKAKQQPFDNAVLIMCPAPFGQFVRGDVHPKFGPTWAGGKEYRGVRTRRYTYVRDLNGPWLLYDNEPDPYQLNNLCNKPEYADLQKQLDDILSQKLKQTRDEFLPSFDYIRKWGYTVDQTGSIPWKW